MSRPIQPAWMPSAGTVLTLASAANRSATTTSVGSTILSPCLAASSVRAGLDLVGLQQRLPDLVTLGRQERVGHPATDQQRVDLRQQRGDDAELVGDLGPAEHHHVGPLRIDGQPLEHRGLGGDQIAGVVRQPLGHVVHAGLLAVHHTEPVGDEGRVRADHGHQIVGQRAALGRVLAGLPRVEPDVLQQGDLAVGQPGDRLLGGLADQVGGHRDRRPEQFGQAGRRRRPASTSGSGCRPAGPGGR